MVRAGHVGARVLAQRVRLVVSKVGALVLVEATPAVRGQPIARVTAARIAALRIQTHLVAAVATLLDAFVHVDARVCVEIVN